MPYYLSYRIDKTNKNVGSSYGSISSVHCCAVRMVFDELVARLKCECHGRKRHGTTPWGAEALGVAGITKSQWPEPTGGNNEPGR
jgi:hypothetical protein